MSCDINLKCEKCELRKAIAKRFDLHWMGEDDCPFTCPEEKSAEEGET